MRIRTNLIESPNLMLDISAMTAIDNVYALPHLAAILVSGLDAEKFLQSQLSSNVAALVDVERAAKAALAFCPHSPQC